jgi:formylglycine-generating enzyme required for sulfatase activity
MVMTRLFITFLLFILILMNSLLLPNLLAQVSKNNNFSSDVPLLPSIPGTSDFPIPPLLNSTEQNVSKSNNNPDAKSKSPISLWSSSDFIAVPGGEIEIGSRPGEGRPDERPARAIHISDFEISRDLVSAGNFCRFLNETGDRARDGSPKINLNCPDCPIVKINEKYIPKQNSAEKPIVCINWFAAVEYAERVGGRLPTSIEWEKAASLMGNRANDVIMITNSNMKPGEKQLTGNFWEWCSDWYSNDYYAEMPAQNPPGPSLGQEKNIRGGSWAGSESSKRTKNRHRAAPQGYFGTVGFRVVKN